MTEPATSDSTPTVGAAPAGRPWFAYARLILALVATVTMLPYAWGRAFLMYLMTGAAEAYYLYMLGIGIVIVMVLTFRLSSKFKSPNTGRNVALLIAAVWIAVMGSVVIFNAGQLISPYIVAAAFLPATVWVVWCAWMFFVPLSAIARGGILVLALLAVLPFALFFYVEGLTGDAKVNFGYRQWSAPQAEHEWQAPSPSQQRISLVSTGKDEFTRFQGPNGSAVLSNVGLSRDWKSTSPKQLWHKEVGAGWSGFAVAGEGAVTQEQRGTKECVVCRNRLTGDEVWVHEDEASYTNTLGGPGPRATPTIFEGAVYAVGATGILNCLDGATGQPRWSVDVLKDNDTKNAFHGVCSSPLIVGNMVVVCPTGSESKSLAAYDRNDGHRIWVKGAREASYASPMLVDVAGVRQILYYAETGVTAHDPATGDVLWSFPWTNSEKTVCSQPIVLPGNSGEVLLTTGYGGGSVLLQASCSPDGKWSEPEQIWKSRYMKTKFMTAVLHDGHVYGLDDGILQCIDVTTGKQKWKGGRFGHGQLLLVDDLLLIQTEPGEVALVEANPKKLVELGRAEALTGKTWNCPSLAGRYLFTRNDHEAVCLELPLAK